MFYNICNRITNNSRNVMCRFFGCDDLLYNICNRIKKTVAIRVPNPRFPICKMSLKTGFRRRMIILKSGIWMSDRIHKKSTHRIATVVGNPIANIVQQIIASTKNRHIALRFFCNPIANIVQQPCGKQHLREIATPDLVGHFTNLAYYLVWFMVVKSLPNPAWLFLGNVVSHIARHTLLMLLLNLY